MNATERQWLLEQMQRRPMSKAAGEPVAGEEARTMIKRAGKPAIEPVATGITSTAPPEVEPAVPSTPTPTTAPTPIFTPSTRRAVPAVAVGKYRAVFACCAQAEDAPTQKLPS